MNMLTRNANGKTRFMRFVSQMLAVILVFVALLGVLPSVTKADAQKVLTSAELTLSNGNKTLTVSFNVYARPNIDVTALKNNIYLWRNYNGKTIAIDNANNTVNMTEDGKLVINLNQPLSNNGARLQINANILKSEDGIVATNIFAFAQNNEVYWFNPVQFSYSASEPNVDVEKKAITTNFDHNIKSNVDNLKDSILLSTSDSGNYEPLAAEDTVLISGTTLTINLNTALAGENNKIKILNGALRYNHTDNIWVAIESDIIFNIDVTPSKLVFVRVENNDDGHEIHLDFSQNTSLLVDNENLKNKLSYSTNGVDFSPLPADAYLNAYNESNKTVYIYQNYFDFRNKIIRFAEDTFVEQNGAHLPAIERALNFSYQSAFLSSDNKDVTLTFNGAVSENTNETEGNLKGYVQYSEYGNQSLHSLLDGDTVSVVDGKLKLHVAAGLKGDSIVVHVSKYALINTDGIIQTEAIITPNLKALTDTTGPRLVLSFITNGNKDIVLGFDENIVLNNVTLEGLKNIITVTPNNYDFAGISGPENVSLSGATISITNQFLIISLEAPLNSYGYDVNIPAGTLKDGLGNLAGPNNTFIYNPDQNAPSLGEYYLSLNNHLLNIDINTNSYLFDYTLDTGISSLHDNISISTDGTNFHGLTIDDIVTLKDNRVVVNFKSAQNARSIYFKIAASTFTNLAGNIQTTDLISGRVQSNKPDFKGNFYSNAPSEFLFENNVIWINAIDSVSINEYSNLCWTERVLDPNEYSILEDKIVVKPGVFKYGVNYELRVHSQGYDSQYAEGYSILPNETYIMTAPKLNRTSGLTASVNVMNLYDPLDLYNGFNFENGNHNATIIFRLKNGTATVDIVAMDSFMIDGTYKAIFNVADASNPNYAVDAFIVSNFNSDISDVGLNLATIKTQNELDLLKSQNGPS